MEHAETFARLKDKNILFLTHDYFSFTKDQIEAVAPFFKSVTVLVRYKPIAALSHIFPSPALRMHRKDIQFDLKDLPVNVSVYPLPLYYIPNNRGYHALGEKHFLAALKFIRKKNITADIIHAHYFWSAGYAGAALKDVLTVPLIITGQGYDVYELPFKDGLWEEKIKRVLSSADKILTVSRSNAGFIEKLGYLDRTKVIPNGFRKELFFEQDQDAQRAALGLPADKKIVIAIGYLDILKGHKFLVDAMQRLKTKRANVLCIIIGTGMEYNNLRARIKDRGLEHDIMMAGSVPHHKLAAWINAADMLVLPSLRESFGVVQIEALACGKPVIATKNGGSEEIITSPDYGILCDAENAEALAAAIDLGLQQSWDKKTILSYADTFTWKAAAAQILQQYYELL